MISIHALLAESDQGRNGQNIKSRHISIHALLAESDEPTAGRNNKDDIFLSTLSLRRATLKLTVRQSGRLRDFYPRSPCGERPVTRVASTPTTVISIHALLAESDRESEPALSQSSEFLSTLSLRRATINTYHRIFGGGISIHALLAESDTIRL